MFRLLSANKRPASATRASFRPQLEDLEGREVPSGLVSTELVVTQPVQIVLSQEVVIADKLLLGGENLNVEKAIRQLEHVTVERMPQTEQAGQPSTTPPQTPPGALGQLFGNLDFLKLPAWDAKNAEGVTWGEAFMEGVDLEGLMPDPDLAGALAFMDRFA
jgi:hypothetical protein